MSRYTEFNKQDFFFSTSTRSVTVIKIIWKMTSEQQNIKNKISREYPVYS